MGKSEDKKSFQLYNDYIDHFSLMSDLEFSDKQGA